MWLVPMAIVLANCTTINANGERVRHRIGYVRVIEPAEDDGVTPVQHTNVDVLGLWIDVDRLRTGGRIGSGLGVGWRSDRLYITPKDCRVVFAIESVEALAQAAAIVESLQREGERLCLVHTPK